MLIVWVPACAECNRELGSKRLFSIKERTLYLIGRYAKKYERFLKGTMWEDFEIDELTGTMKHHVQDFSTMERAIDRRLAILEENLKVRSVQY